MMVVIVMSVEEGGVKRRCRCENTTNARGEGLSKNYTRFSCWLMVGLCQFCNNGGE